MVTICNSSTLSDIESIRQITFFEDDFSIKNKEALDALSIEAINGFTEKTSQNWNNYFQLYQNDWEALPKEKATAFINAFISHNQEALAVNRVLIDFDQVLKPTIVAEVNNLGNNSIRWLLLLSMQNSDFLEASILGAMNTKLLFQVYVDGVNGAFQDL